MASLTAVSSARSPLSAQIHSHGLLEDKGTTGQTARCNLGRQFPALRWRQPADPSPLIGGGRQRGAGVVCHADSRDSVRKALEQALGNNESVKRWEREIQEREAAGGGGSGGQGGQGRGWNFGGFGGSSGGGGGGPFQGEAWEDRKQTLLAIGGIVLVYLIFTQGKQMVAFVLNSILFVLRGFKKSPRRTSAALDSLSSDGADTGAAESEVVKKWGSD